MSKRLIVGMSLEVLVLAVVLIGAGIFLLLPKDSAIRQRVESVFRRDSKPAATPVPHEETTSKPGLYRCADGKSFTLTIRMDGTARVAGASSAGVVLRRTTGAAIWTSDSGRVAVREIADYTILVENDITTRDLCRRL